jgi:hypothetical protein
MTIKQSNVSFLASLSVLPCIKCRSRVLVCKILGRFKNVNLEVIPLEIVNKRNIIAYWPAKSFPRTLVIMIIGICCRVKYLIRTKINLKLKIQNRIKKLKIVLLLVLKRNDIRPFDFR